MRIDTTEVQLTEPVSLLGLPTGAEMTQRPPPEAAPARETTAQKLETWTSLCSLQAAWQAGGVFPGSFLTSECLSAF